MKSNYLINKILLNAPKTKTNSLKSFAVFNTYYENNFINWIIFLFCNFDEIFVY